MEAVNLEEIRNTNIVL